MILVKRVLLSAWYLAGSIFGPAPRVTIERPIDPVIPLVTATGSPMCTGFVVGQDLIATAAHCVDGDPIHLVLAGALIELETVAVGQPGSATDVALLKGPTGTIKPLELGELELPTSCFFYGFAGGQQENLMPCFLYQKQFDGVVGGMGEVRPGDSGGPILGMDGKVIGVTFAGSYMDPRAIYIAPVESLKKLIQDVKGTGAASSDAAAGASLLK